MDNANANRCVEAVGYCCVKVTIKLLNIYRQYLPDNARGSTYSLQVPTGTRIAELLTQVPVPVEETQVVLVNGSTPSVDQVLIDGDTVAIFPTIAGG
jgi:sulfur carrier protein ThiS